MSFSRFSEDEMEVVKTIPGPKGSYTEIFNTPISPRENLMRMYAGKTPMWIPSPSEMATMRKPVSSSMESSLL